MERGRAAGCTGDGDSQVEAGEDHPDTLVSMANIAFTWKSSGRNAEAIELLRTCLGKREQILGLNHPDTLNTSSALLEWTPEALDVSV